jgi:hypothetical protein
MEFSHARSAQHAFKNLTARFARKESFATIAQPLGPLR